jgi:hypothetical protein
MLFTNRRLNKNLPEMINFNELQIRDYKINDKINLFRILNEYRREFYVNVYKLCFKSWFTYAFTCLLMAITYTMFNNSTATLFAPPLITTIYLLYKVNKYRNQYNRQFNIYDIENLTLGSSSVKRKQNQGVYVCLYKDEIIAYCIYMKQTDELETVCVKEICVMKEFRRRKIATYFLDYLCKNIFKPFLYRRVTFTVSDLFNNEANNCCAFKKDYIKKIYSWRLFFFVPGVSDMRTVYSIDFGDICKID